MPNDTNPKTDDSKERNDVTAPLADSWLAFVETPDKESAQNRFATELNDLVRKFLVAGSLMEPLRNMREDLGQEASLLLFSRLLAGNKELVAATRAGNRKEIAGQIRRSVSAAIRFSKWKLFSKLAGRPVQLQPDKDKREISTYQHPANFKALRELPLDAQHKLVMNMLRRAVRELHLTPGNADLAQTLIENNLTQAELARSIGVTREAVHQRLKPVWRFLRKAIDDEEFPLS